MTRVNLTLEGYKLYFHTAEFPWEHAHFNLEPTSGEWKIKVRFLSCAADVLDYETVRAPNRQKNWKPLPKNKKDELLGLIAEHRDELQRQWDDIIQFSSRMDSIGNNNASGI